MKNQKLIFALSLMFGLNAFALPEQQLGTRTNGKILEIFKDNNYQTDRIQEELRHSGIPALDNLWATRKDFKQCLADGQKCLILSRFPGAPNGQPLVILPGFTGYRKMFLEYIHDMAEKGFGPIYISDFTGTGDSYKSYADDGVSVPTLQERLNDKKYKKGVGNFHDRLSLIAKDSVTKNQIEEAVLPLPLGAGWIKDFDDYQRDLNFIMQFAAKENSEKKLVVTSLSMSGLVLMMGLHYQGKNPTWIKSVSRIVLESPMLRLHATDGALAGLITQIGTAAASAIFGSKTLVSPESAFPGFVDKATGYFEPENIISHSVNRLSLIDSLRVWNGAETAGSTYGWVGQELKNQFAVKITDPKFSNLNSKVKNIAKALVNNNIVLIAAVSDDDPLTDSEATKKFFKELAQKGVKNSHVCALPKARHQLHAESDFYREPFMALLFDQGANPVVKPSYGGGNSSEMKCRASGF
jgi:hypothetical protein